jgi:integrase
MAVYRPTYKDKETGETRTQSIWWYHFMFGGRHIQESSKSPRKSVAKEAEKNRRHELEHAFNSVKDKRKERIRSIKKLAAKFLEDYEVRHPASKTFAKYAVGHVTRILGTSMAVDISDETVRAYQTTRLREHAAPNAINEEVGFLLRLLGEQGDVIRAKLRRKKELKLSVKQQVARAFTPAEKDAMLNEAKKRRSPAIYPALMLALHAGVRDKELRSLQWDRVDLQKAKLIVGDSKTDAGVGRTIPLNADVLAALVAHSRWYLEKFGETRPEWYVFPFGKPQPTDPTRPQTSFKTVWAKVKDRAGVAGRWHDNRHTWITDLAESGEASDETIRDLAGHVSKQMLKHYSHIRMEAKRRAVAALVKKPAAPAEGEVVGFGNAKESAKVEPVN